MIDWISASVPLTWKVPINDGQFVKVKADGTVEWQVDRRKAVEGSYSSKVTVRTVKAGFVEISGNPAKFLQGHNLFGTDDLVPLMVLFMETLCGCIGVVPTEFDRAAWANGAYDISRIDINYMFPLRSRSDVRAWLRAAQETTRVKHRGRGISKEGTLYFGLANKGERAKAWQMKLYCKADELELRDVPVNPDDWEDARRGSGVDPLPPLPVGVARLPWAPNRKDSKQKDLTGWGGNLPHNIPCREQLCQWADNKLRIELVLRTAELKKLGLRCANMWSVTVVREVFSSYLSKLEIGEAVMVAVEDVEKLPRCLRRTYNEWKLGVDLRQELPKVTFHRHRKAILEALSVDIGVLQPKTATVIPLRRAIVLGEAAPVPEWAPPAICVRAA